jgi:AcrR family transcriptional regulator
MPAGRPRTFDSDAALEKAMQVFWRQGYEGTSLSDLTEAMGINRPSLYAAYGNKEALFRQVLERYESGPSAYVEEALAAPTGRGCIERLMNGAADVASGPGYPGGCLMIQGMLAAGGEAQSIRREMTRRRTAGVSAVAARLERARADGELPVNCDVRALAGFYVTVIRGMAVQGADGASRAELQSVIDMAMTAWPMTEQPARKRRAN